MLFVLLTVLVMGIVAYAQFKESVLTSFVMLVNVVIAGVVACNFFEPLADTDIVKFMNGAEDFVMLILLFAATLAALRWATNSVAPTEIDYHPMMSQVGSILCGLVTGYLVAGFLVVAVQTLPLDEHFMGFEAEITTAPSYAYLHHGGDATGEKRETAADKQGGESLRRILPPDRIWLAMMQRASYGGLGDSDRDAKNGFDPYCNFPLRYERYRRYGDSTAKPDAKPWDEVLPVKPGGK